MAQPHCDKHKRYVPYCDDCKAIVAAAEQAAALVEEEEAVAEASEALQAEVGFPGSDEESPASSSPADVGFTPTPPEVQPTVTGEGAEGGPDAEPQPVREVVDEIRQALAEEFPDEPKLVPTYIDETEEAMAEDGEFDLPTQPGYIGPPLPPSITLGPTTDAAARVLEEIADALDRGEEVTVLFGNAEQGLRQEGRKEVIGWVKEWFADSQDTGAHQLLEYLAKRSK